MKENCFILLKNIGHRRFLGFPFWCSFLRMRISLAVNTSASNMAVYNEAMFTVLVKKNPHIFLFHGETALHKILKFQGETANFSEKFQGEIAEFLRENMELYRQNLKISGRNTGISWRNLEKFSTISPRKKRQLIMEKNKKWGFFFTCTVYLGGKWFTQQNNRKRLVFEIK